MSTKIKAVDGVIEIEGHNGLIVEIHEGGRISLSAKNNTIYVMADGGEIIIDGHRWWQMLDEKCNDTTRLDWLQQGHSITASASGFFGVDGFDRDRLKRDLRDAIDKAMKEKSSAAE